MPSTSRPGISVPIRRLSRASTRRADGRRPRRSEAMRRPSARPAVNCTGSSSGSAWTTPGSSSAQVPDSFDGWKLLGQIELFRELTPGQTRVRGFAPRSTRFSICRWSVRPMRCGGRPSSGLAISRRCKSLQMAYDARLMYEAALPVLDRLAAPADDQPHAGYRASQEPSGSGRVLAKAGRATGDDMAKPERAGSDRDRPACRRPRASAAELLEQAYPPEKASWEIIDKIATLRLHLGEPARARELWEKATAVPQAGRSRRAHRHDLPGRRRFRCRPAPLSAGPQGRPHAVRGTLLPGRARARCRQCSAGLRAWRARP